MMEGGHSRFVSWLFTRGMKVGQVEISKLNLNQLRKVPENRAAANSRLNKQDFLAFQSAFLSSAFDSKPMRSNIIPYLASMAGCYQLSIKNPTIYFQSERFASKGKIIIIKLYLQTVNDSLVKFNP